MQLNVGCRWRSDPLFHRFSTLSVGSDSCMGSLSAFMDRSSLYELMLHSGIRARAHGGSGRRWLHRAHERQLNECADSW